MKRQWLVRSRLRVAALSVLFTTLIGCSVDTGPSVEFKPAATQQGAEPVSSSASVAEAELGGIPAETDPNSSLGFVYKRGEAIGIKNGGRVPLDEDRVAEVFLAPYPPDWQTDLHLFLMDKATFQPVTDIEVELDYEMFYMDHGIDTQIGTKVGDGHYVMPLSFLMYGDWLVDATLQLPERKKHLRFIVKFFP